MINNADTHPLFSKTKFSGTELTPQEQPLKTKPVYNSKEKFLSGFHLAICDFKQSCFVDKKIFKDIAKKSHEILWRSFGGFLG